MVFYVAVMFLFTLGVVAEGFWGAGQECVDSARP